MNQIGSATKFDSQSDSIVQDRRTILVKLATLAVIGGLAFPDEAFGSDDQVKLLVVIFTDALTTHDVRASLAKYGGGAGLPTAAIDLLKSLRSSDLKVLAQFRQSALHLDGDLRSGVLGCL